MTRRPLTDFDDYLLGRIATLEKLLLEYDPKKNLSSLQGQLSEAKITLKKFREITKAKGKRE